MVHLGSSPPRVGLTCASQQPRKVGIWWVSGMRLRRPLTPRGSGPGKRRDEQQRASMVGSEARPSSTFVAAQDWAVTCRRQGSRPPRRYFCVAAWRGVCPIQVQGTIRGPALPGSRGPRMNGPAGDRSQSNAAPRGPGQNSGPHRLQPRQNTTPLPGRLLPRTESDGYPQSALGVLATPRARRILLGASSPPRRSTRLWLQRTHQLKVTRHRHGRLAQPRDSRLALDGLRYGCRSASQVYDASPHSAAGALA
jgi:hypothetical protein